jgi:hypothetical protein
VSTYVPEEIVAIAEKVAVGVLTELSGGCTPERILSGNTKRGPAFVYLCQKHASLSIVSIPAGGLRNRAKNDPTSRTRIASFPLDRVTVEVGAYIESDGTVRASFTVHVPNDDELEWEIIAGSAEEVGRAAQALTGAVVGSSGTAPSPGNRARGRSRATDPSG